MSKNIKIGIAGIGTVGSSVINILNNKKISNGFDENYHLTISQVAVRNIHSQRNCDMSGIDITTNPLDIANNPNVDIVIEAIGDVAISLELAKTALQNSKPLVSANKALLALHGAELFALAKKNATPLLFEAAVAGGIPIIKVLRDCVSANNISTICGIINGTSNYLLTKMAKEGVAYDSVLKEAQDLGYAEANPTFDVEGIDAAHKICLLAQIVFKTTVDFAQIYHQGLAHIELADFYYAERMGYLIKPLAVAKKSNEAENLEVAVYPALVSKENTISQIDGVFNAVQIYGDQFNQILLSGPGAGGPATASAVVSDTVEIAQAMVSDSHIKPVINPTSLSKILPIEQCKHSYFIRLKVEDKPGMMKKCSKMLSQSAISIEALIQDEPQHSQSIATIAIITNETQEQTIIDVLEKIVGMDGFENNYSLIRLFK